MRRPGNRASSTRTIGASANASGRRRSGARPSFARRCATPEWMPSSCRPTRIWATRFYASPTCANGAPNWRRAAACRSTCEKTVKFLWPETLWLLFAVPVLVAVYVVLLRRRKKVALRYASLTIVKEAMGAGQSMRRHVPPLLILLALTTMFVAVGRPVAVVTLPSQHETVILAMDVSGSMRATDVKPNRLAASHACFRRRPSRGSPFRAGTAG